MSNPIIGPLRAKYLDLTNREADWSARYGANHVSVQNVRIQIKAIRQSISDELGRIEETAKGELEIAQKGQRELETSLATALSKTQDANQAQVTLFSLEAAAKSYRRPEIIKFYPDLKSRVVRARSAEAWNGESLAPAALRKMVDSAITSLTGLKDAKSAWLALFDPACRCATSSPLRNSRTL